LYEYATNRVLAGDAIDAPGYRANSGPRCCNPRRTGTLRRGEVQAMYKEKYGCTILVVFEAKRKFELNFGLYRDGLF
jgi:hypothetical protein